MDKNTGFSHDKNIQVKNKNFQKLLSMLYKLYQKFK